MPDPNRQRATVEPAALLAEVTDTDGTVWTRYHTDPTGHGKHWWAFGHGWQAFRDLHEPTPVPVPEPHLHLVR